VWSVVNVDANAITFSGLCEVGMGFKVGRPDSNGFISPVRLIGTLCLAGTEDGIMFKSADSPFEPVKTGGLGGMGGAGFRVIPEPRRGRGDEVKSLLVWPCSEAKFCALIVGVDCGVCFTVDW
jgi:hypothetical protein